MTNHPNQFAIGQQVLFVSRTDPLAEWRAGAIASAADISSLSERVDYGDYRRWEKESEKHDKECEGFLYSILCDGAQQPVSEVCTCRYRLADADASRRWPQDTLITERRQFQLLWTDTGGDLRIDSSNTPLEETDIVHLSKGDTSVEVDMHDLLKWAATPGGEG